MPLSPAELESSLEDSLDAVLSSRRTVSAPARELAELDDAEQRFALKWLDVVCASNAELGYHFITRAAGALSRLPLAPAARRSEEHTSELQSREKLVCRLLLQT